MTSPLLPSGSDRLFAVSRQIAADIYVNIQADEPLLQPAHIEALLRPFTQIAPTESDPGPQVTTLKVRCPQASINDPNVVKVVTGKSGRALYFSRAAIPFDRDNQSTLYWKHLGLYAYRRAALERFVALPPGLLEQREKLEQLRALEAGMRIDVALVDTVPLGVDTPAELERARAALAS